jgi:hypothetical protein
MTIYRTRYCDPKRNSWVNEWSLMYVVAKRRRIEVGKRLVLRTVEIEAERLEVNLGKGHHQFLNELAA